MVHVQKLARREAIVKAQGMANRETTALERSGSDNDDESTPALLFCKDKAAQPNGQVKSGGISGQNGNGIHLDMFMHLLMIASRHSQVNYYRQGAYLKT